MGPPVPGLEPCTSKVGDCDSPLWIFWSLIHFHVKPLGMWGVGGPTLPCPSTPKCPHFSFWSWILVGRGECDHRHQRGQETGEPAASLGVSFCPACGLLSLACWPACVPVAGPAISMSQQQPGPHVLTSAMAH